MIYRTKNKIEAQNAIERLNFLISKGKKVEIKDKKATRSLSLNAYQHVLFAYYGLHTGYTRDEVKQDIFKRYICRDIFVYLKNGIEVCKSTADLDNKVASLALNRFIDRALIDLGLKLPQPHEKEFVAWCKEETERYSNARYL